MWRLLLLACPVFASFAGCGASYPPPPDDAWFKSHVTDQTLPVLVDFNATWCMPCKQLKPSLDRIEAKYESRLKVVPIDVEERPSLAAHYKVESIPRLLLFKNGQVVADIVGGMGYQDLESWILPNLN